MNPQIKDINKIYTGRTLNVPSQTSQGNQKNNVDTRQSRNPNLVRFSEKYPKYGDDGSTPLVYTIGRREVPQSMYDELYVNPETGQVSVTPEQERQLALQPSRDALNVQHGLGDALIMKAAPVIDAINNLRNQTALFNDTRVANARRYPEVMNAVQEGGDIAGNAAMSVLAGGTLLGIGGKVFTMLANGQLLELGLGAIGSYLGHEAGDAIVQDVSNGKYYSLADYMQKEGHIWPFVTETYNPFTYAGGQLFSRVPGFINQKLVPYLSQAIPAESIVPEPAQAPYAQGGDPKTFGQGSIYRGQLTNPKVGTVKGKNWLAKSGDSKKIGGSKKTGVNPRPEQQTQQWDYNQNFTHIGKVITPTGEYNPIWMPMYNGDVTMPPPPPPLPPVNENFHHLVEESREVDPFEEWYSVQREGTTQYWPGAAGSNYGAGWIKIDRTGDISHVYVDKTRTGVGKPDDISRVPGTPARTYGRTKSRTLIKNRPGKPEHWVKVRELNGALPNVDLDYVELPITYY